MILKFQTELWDEKEKRFRKVEFEVPDESEKIIFSMKVLEDERG